MRISHSYVAGVSPLWLSSWTAETMASLDIDSIPQLTSNNCSLFVGHATSSSTWICNWWQERLAWVNQGLAMLLLWVGRMVDRFGTSTIPYLGVTTTTNAYQYIGGAFFFFLLSIILSFIDILKERKKRKKRNKIMEEKEKEKSVWKRKKQGRKGHLINMKRLRFQMWT